MHDLVNYLELIAITKDDLGQFGSVEFAIVAHHVGSEVLHDVVKHRHSADLQAFYGGIRVYQARSMGHQTLAYR